MQSDPASLLAFVRTASRAMHIGLAGLLSSACGPAPARMADGFIFDPDWVLEVHIELAPEDFEEMRHQQRDFDDVLCAGAPPPNPYTYFEADITVDGITVSRVGVKGRMAATKVSWVAWRISPGRRSFSSTYR